ncbi:MAG: beta-ketoacyl-ACP synthase III [Phycisphaera sp.]|nr:beta-ketoacyl-ACP synthase III [Phycisphaera sp.]
MTSAQSNTSSGGRTRPVLGATIVGTGLAVPSRVLSNADLEKLVDTSDEWIVQRTGIRERHISENGETTMSLGVKAVRQALDNAKLDPSDLDLLICATLTQDMICPATACRIVAELGAVPCGAMDISVACTGFVAGMNIAANFVASGQFRNVAVVGAEQLSRIVNYEDRNTCVLFGDGAGAAIVSATDNADQGCLYQSLHSDGTGWMQLYCPRSEAEVPEGGVFNGQVDTLQMNGREVYKFAVNTLQSTILDAIEGSGLSVDDIAMVIPHQSNTRILDSARVKLGLPEEKMYVNLPRYGNTSAASVGLCLHELMNEGKLKTGDVVLLVALGGGLTWGASVWRL